MHAKFQPISHQFEENKIFGSTNVFVEFSNDVESAETLFYTKSDVADHDRAVEISISPLISEILTF